VSGGTEKEEMLINEMSVRILCVMNAFQHT
jgi:hypothetical protein